MTRFTERFRRFAAPQQDREHGLPAVFVRGNLHSEPFVIRRFLGRRHEAMGQEIGVSIKTEMQSWIAPVDVFRISGALVTPQSGDTIEADGETWEIHAPDNATPPVERHQGGSDWVIHTRVVE